jgi:hypothetical protein
LNKNKLKQNISYIDQLLVRRARFEKVSKALIKIIEKKKVGEIFQATEKNA